MPTPSPRPVVDRTTAIYATFGTALGVAFTQAHLAPWTALITVPYLIWGWDLTRKRRRRPP